MGVMGGGFGSGIPRFDHGPGPAIAQTVNHAVQIVKEVGDKLAYRDDKPCQRLVQDILKRIEEELR